MKRKLAFSILAFLLVLGFGFIRNPYSTLADETKTISTGEIVNVPVQKAGGDYFAYLDINEVGTYIVNINWGSEVTSGQVTIRNEIDILVQNRELGVSTFVASGSYMKYADSYSPITHLQFPVWQIPEPKKVAILISYKEGEVENPTTSIKIEYLLKQRVNTDTFSGSIPANQSCDTTLFSLPAPAETGYYNITVSSSSTDTFISDLGLFNYFLGVVNNPYLFSSETNTKYYIAYLQQENPINGSVKICRGLSVLRNKKIDYNAEIKLEKITPTPLKSTSTEDLSFYSMENTGFDTLKVNGTGKFAIVDPFGSITNNHYFDGKYATDTLMFPIIPNLPDWQLEFRNTLEPFPSFPLRDDLQASVFVQKRLEISTDFFGTEQASAMIFSDLVARINGTENLYIFDGMFDIEKSTTTPLSASSPVSFDPTEDGIPIFQFTGTDGKALEGKATVGLDETEPNYSISGSVNVFGPNFMNSYNVIRSDQTASPEFPAPMLSDGNYYVVPSFDISYQSPGGVSFDDLKKPVMFEFNVTDIPQLEFDKETTVHTGFMQKDHSEISRLPTAKLLTFDVKAGESFYVKVDVGVSSSSPGTLPAGSYGFVSFVDTDGNYPFYELTPAFAGYGISYFGQVFTAVRDAKVYTTVYGYGDVNVTIVKVGSADIALPISTEAGGGFLPVPFMAFLSALVVVPLIIKKKRKN